MSDEYQPRTQKRLLEVLRGANPNPRSYQHEAAREIERLSALVERQPLMVIALNEARAELHSTWRAAMSKARFEAHPTIKAIDAALSSDDSRG